MQNHTFVKSPEWHNEYSHDKRMKYKNDLEDVGQPQVSHRKRANHPTVSATGPTSTTDACTLAVNRLKAGPPNVPQIIYDKKVWTDDTFNGMDTIYWAYGDTASKKTTYDTIVDRSGGKFTRWPVNMPNAKIFKDATSPHYTDPRQGGAGTCYIMQAMSGVAEFPDIIKSIFLTNTDNEAGIYALRFFIRGKPWVVAIDDQLFFSGTTTQSLYFSKADATDSSMWAPLLEKAWAKIKGNYVAADGGFIVSGVRALTGVPGFIYDVQSIRTDTDRSLSGQSYQ